MKTYFRSIPVLFIFIMLLSCASTKVHKNATLEERMAAAMKMYEKGDYLDSRTQFRIITLSHSGSTIADKAQFYLAESHFNLKEYILSASEYERLIKVYPASDYVDDAKYKLGLSYYNLSPKYQLDQTYTEQAILHFQEFLEDYYTSPLVKDVERKLNEARDKLAHKVYASADIYRKMNYNTSAIIYFNKVLENYYDSQYAPKAQYWIGECNRKLDNYQESLTAFEDFVRKYPEHEWMPRVKEKMQQVRDYLKEHPPSDMENATASS